MSNPLSDIGHAVAGAAEGLVPGLGVSNVVNPSATRQAETTVKKVATKATSPVSGVVQAVTAPFKAFSSISSAGQTVISDITSKGFWIRVAVGGIGLALLVSGVMHLTGADEAAKQIASKVPLVV
jgi:hypothetical protein